MVGIGAIFTCARYTFNPRDAFNYEMFLMDEGTNGGIITNRKRKYLWELGR